MPADALPIPLDGPTPPRRTMRATAATATALGTFTLTFGPYLDLAGAPTYVGMTGKLALTQPMVTLAGGTISQPLAVTIGADGTTTVPGLVFNDDPNVVPGTQYQMQWDVGRFSPSPGNKTFTVSTSAGATVDFDPIAVAVTSAPTPAAPGAPANLDALVAALLSDPSSATYAAALNLPEYPHA